MIRTLLALLTALSVALCLAAGVLLGAGWRGPGYLLGALGAGWLGILYGHLIRLVEREDRRE